MIKLISFDVMMLFSLLPVLTYLIYKKKTISRARSRWCRFKRIGLRMHNSKWFQIAPNDLCFTRSSRAYFIS